MNKLTISVSDMAEQLGISKPKAYELVHAKGFPALHVGRRIIIPVDAFHHWVNKSSTHMEKSVEWGQVGLDRMGSYRNTACRSDV